MASDYPPPVSERAVVNGHEYLVPRIVAERFYDLSGREWRLLTSPTYRLLYTSKRWFEQTLSRWSRKAKAIRQIVEGN